MSRRKYAADATGVEHLERGLDPVAPAREAYIHDRQYRTLGNSQPDRLFRGICGPHNLEPGFGERVLEFQPDDVIILDNQDPWDFGALSAREALVGGKANGLPRRG